MAARDELSGRLLERRDALVAGWLDRIAGTYHHETTRFLKGQPDRFANPVGARLRACCSAVVDGMLAARPAGELAPALDEVIRVRAVQEFTPSEALRFVFELKPLVRDSAGPADEAALLALERWIDELALAAFEVYVACREQIYRIRVKAIEKRSLTAIERLNAWRDRRDANGGENTVEPT